ncbi:9974_t:CDS:2, partial [Entrophospora sp. SA101]
MELVKLDEKLSLKKTASKCKSQITALNVFDAAYKQQTNGILDELDVEPVKKLHIMTESINKKNDDEGIVVNEYFTEHFSHFNNNNFYEEDDDYTDETIIKLEGFNTIDDNDKMCSDKKWKLPSNKYVEDILYEYAKDLPYE